jgi:hypothetical protein
LLGALHGVSANGDYYLSLMEMSREVRVREIGNNVDQRMVVCGNAVPFEQRAKRAALLSRPSDQHCHD